MKKSLKVPTGWSETVNRTIQCQKKRWKQMQTIYGLQNTTLKKHDWVTQTQLIY